MSVHYFRSTRSRTFLTFYSGNCIFYYFSNIFGLNWTGLWYIFSLAMLFMSSKLTCSISAWQFWNETKRRVIQTKPSKPVLNRFHSNLSSETQSHGKKYFSNHFLNHVLNCSNLWNSLDLLSRSIFTNFSFFFFYFRVEIIVIGLKLVNYGEHDPLSRCHFS